MKTKIAQHFKRFKLFHLCYYYTAFLKMVIFIISTPSFEKVQSPIDSNNKSVRIEYHVNYDI